MSTADDRTGAEGRRFVGLRDGARRAGFSYSETAKRGHSPALREVMRLFRQLAGADRERFFVWYANGMKGE